MNLILPNFKIVVLDYMVINSKEEFENWLIKYASCGLECFVSIKKGEPKDDGQFYYLDAVEIALCYGYIDSVQRKVDNLLLQRFSPRRKNSPWTELNKERVRRLIKLNRMTPLGYKVLPKLNPSSYKIDPDLVRIMKKNRVYSKFKKLHPLYQRVRTYNISFYKTRYPDLYYPMVDRFIAEIKHGKMPGNWHDYGRLLSY